MKKLIVSLLVLGCIHGVYAGDDRFGVATHFDQGWSITLMPLIKALGVGWIRDDTPAWWWEHPAGHYVPPAGKELAWLTAAKAQGLKVVGIMGPNTNYPGDPYNQVAMSNLAVWMAKSGLIQVLEITNEPNNIKEFQGAAGQAKLVALTNAVRAAVHKAVPGVEVIGLDEQGSEITNMLAMRPAIDGLVYHPYYSNPINPASVYEPPDNVYAEWVQDLREKTKLPFWETEWGFWGGPLQGSRILARLKLTQILRVEHTFIYEFRDNGAELYGLVDNSGKPKPAYYVVQKFIFDLRNK
jgi:hypothetical protein